MGSVFSKHQEYSIMRFRRTTNRQIRRTKRELELTWQEPVADTSGSVELRRQNIPFFQLPLEMRNQIYSYIIPERVNLIDREFKFTNPYSTRPDEQDILQSEQDKAGQHSIDSETAAELRARRRENSTRTAEYEEESDPTEQPVKLGDALRDLRQKLPIIFCNKQTAAEALSLLYKETTFCILEYCTRPADYLALLTSLPRSQLNRIQHLHFDVWTLQTHLCIDAASDTTTTSPTAEWTPLLETIATMPALRSIALELPYTRTLYTPAHFLAVYNHANPDEEAHLDAQAWTHQGLAFNWPVARAFVFLLARGGLAELRLIWPLPLPPDADLDALPGIEWLRIPRAPEAEREDERRVLDRMGRWLGDQPDADMHTAWREYHDKLARDERLDFVLSLRGGDGRGGSVVVCRRR
ncbi:hypothetical protein M501DRAFT_806706, partial [Patellaria atrata CBS 101060]